MDEKIKQGIQEVVDDEPLKRFGLKLLGIGAEKMAFETAGSVRKIIKVDIYELKLKIVELLGLKYLHKTEGQSLKSRIAEHREVEEDLAEVFGPEHLLRNGVFRAKVPITKSVILGIFENNPEVRPVAENLNADEVYELEMLVETQTLADELKDPEKSSVTDLCTCLVTYDNFLAQDDIPAALQFVRSRVDRNFLSEYDEKLADEEYAAILREIVTKIIQFTKKTGQMIDIFGGNNITIFAKEDGTLDYHLLDVILPGTQGNWNRNIVDDPNLELLRHYYTFYYSISGLAEKLGIIDNLKPEDLVYFKGTGVPAVGKFFRDIKQ